MEQEIDVDILLKKLEEYALDNKILKTASEITLRELERLQRGENITIRDHFAMAAMNGLVAGDYLLASKGVAVRAYEIADNMLRERETKSVGVPSYEPPTCTCSTAKAGYSVDCLVHGMHSNRRE